MQFEYNPVQLIQEIRKRPGIWDSRSREHKSKLARERLWRGVIKALNPSTEKLNATDKHELEVQLQKRWKSMRDAYTKQVNYPDRYKRHRPYMYTEELKFLDGQMCHMSKRPYLDNQDDDEQDGSTNNKRWKKMAVARINDSEDNYEDITFLGEDDDDDDEDEVLQDQASNVKSPNVQNFVFADVESTPPHSSLLMENNSSLMEDDPDRLFLLSLLPNLRNVPEHIKLSVKMNMMQVLQNATASKMERCD